MHEHDDNPCWDAHCAPHLTHHDAGVRELVARAEARAWDMGYSSGFSNAMRRMSDEPDAPTTPNPYRVEATR